MPNNQQDSLSTSSGASSAPATPGTLRGKKALVTGASGGLGRAIALLLARDGAEVIAHGRDEARGSATVDAVRAAGGSARFIAADLDDPASVKRLIDETGEIEVLVNNAGFATWGATSEYDLAGFDAMFKANVRAPFALVAAFAPAMVARKSGSIINITSMAGTIGMVGGAAYGATKAALDSLTRAWAAEFSPHGVRVNSVAPGPIHTHPAARAQLDAMGATTALKRASEPSEIAEVVAFLASSRASYVTGAIIAADGGRTAI